MAQYFSTKDASDQTSDQLMKSITEKIKATMAIFSGLDDHDKDKGKDEVVASDESDTAWIQFRQLIQYVEVKRQDAEKTF